MKFGIYVHIPYCIQRCSYCDFATFEQHSILPPAEYISVILKEIELKERFFPKGALTSLYFGGGTPSLLQPMLLKSVIDKLKEKGFLLDQQTEVTIEINPATITSAKMDSYLAMGVNRFSVGAQTFKNSLLKHIRREHDADQTRETLRLLRSYKVNFSFDILFGLPHQTAQDLQLDLEEVAQFQPHHVSPYCLTLPKGHHLNENRPTDDVQIEMFEQISSFLQQRGYQPYEISNFALPGYESKHNSLYWSFDSYWGIGLSSHSFYNQQSQDSGFSSALGVDLNLTVPNETGLSKASKMTRFWNSNSLPTYIEQINSFQHAENFTENLPSNQFEILSLREALTDFCHVSLRTRSGLSLQKAQSLFDSVAVTEIESRIHFVLEQQKKNSHVANQEQGSNYVPYLEQYEPGIWRLSPTGILISNQIFADFLFS